MSNQQYKAKSNQEILLRIIDEVIREKYQITLSPDFPPILDNMLNAGYSRFGQKPDNLSDEQHLKNLNKWAITEAIDYISQHIQLFPKIANTQNNAVMKIINQNQSQNQPLEMLTGGNGNVNSGAIVPYNPAPVNLRENNLYKNTDDIYNQMAYNQNSLYQPTGGNGNGSGHMSSGGSNGNNQPQFSLPMDTGNQRPPEQALMEAMEQRRRDFPSMKTPSYPTSNGGGGGHDNYAGQSGQPFLMSLILQTPIADQNPNLIPAIISEISQMSHLSDLMNKNPDAFKAKILEPGFLTMLVNSIKNKADPKNKPMDYQDLTNVTNVTNTEVSASGGSGNGSDESMTELTKRMNLYKSGAGDDQPNLMNKFIPPSEQLISHMLPELETPHLIDYHLALDFRTDLESSTKNRYLLKFNKYGHISKVKLGACLIPENDYLANQPYIFVKVEELGGRVFTSNHDCVFGKLILSENRNGYLYYKPDENSCQQVFSQPQTLHKLTISFLNYQGQYLNLKEIQIAKQVKLKEKNKLKFITEYRHKLAVNEDIQIHIHRPNLGQIDEYNVQVESILDDHTFLVDNVFEVLSNKIKVMKMGVNCSLTFQLSEINWNLLTQKNAQNAQLIRLSQLVTERKHDHLTTDVKVNLDKTLADSIKLQLPPQIPPQPQIPVQSQFPSQIPSQIPFQFQPQPLTSLPHYSSTSKMNYPGGR